MSRLKYKDANGNWQYATSYHQVTSTGGVTPEGTISITKNGTHDVTNYASAEVDVPVGVFPTGTLEITENGIHDVYDKMAVSVNVPTSGGSGGDDTALTSILDGSYSGEYANDSVTTLHDYRFYNFKQLTKVDCPNLTKLGTSVFYYASGLLEVNFPNITQIPDSTFYYASKLPEFIGRNVTEVGSNAFRYAIAVTKIDLGAVTSIGNRAFNSCNNLETLILRNSSSVPSLYSTNAFGSTKIEGGTGYIYVPSAMIDSYKADSSWSTYAAQFRAIEDYPDICG